MANEIDPKALENLMNRAGFSEEAKAAARAANVPVSPEKPKRRTRGHGATEAQQVTMPEI